MKIGILSQNSALYSTSRLVQAAELRGHQVQVIDPLLCYMDITSHRPSVYYRSRKLDDFEAIIPRIGASVTFYATAVLRQFEMMGVYSLNESVAISRSRDKLRALQLLARKGIGMPVSGFAHSTKMSEELIKLVGGAPLVIKLLEGTQGKGVVLAETQQAAESVIDAFRMNHRACLPFALCLIVIGVHWFIVALHIVDNNLRDVFAGRLFNSLKAGRGIDFDHEGPVLRPQNIHTGHAQSHRVCRPGRGLALFRRELDRHR